MKLAIIIFFLLMSSYVDAATEDLTTYTVDATECTPITVTSAKADCTGASSCQTRSEDCHVTKDFGANNFDDFTHRFEFFNKDASGNGLICWWAVQDEGIDGKDCSDMDTSNVGLALYTYQNDGVVQFWDLATNTTSDFSLSQNTAYWIEISRSGTSCDVTIWDDDYEGNEVDSIAGFSCATTAYQYHSAMLGYDTGASGANRGWTQNFDLDAAAAPPASTSQAIIIAKDQAESY